MTPLKSFKTRLIRLFQIQIAAVSIVTFTFSCLSEILAFFVAAERLITSTFSDSRVKQVQLDPLSRFEFMDHKSTHHFLDNT